MPYLGRGTAIGIGEETTWGTAVARTHWFRAKSVEMKRSVKKNRRNVLAEATGSRNVRAHYIESDLAGGTFTILVGLEGMGMLIKHILHGTPSTTGANPYTHTYKFAANAPTGGLTIEVIRGNGTAEVFEGCRITKATFKIVAGGLMEVTCEVIAETSGGRVSAGTATYTANELEVIHHEAGTVSWNAQTYTPAGLEFTLDNKFGTRMLLGSKLTKEPQPSAFLEVKVKLDVEWENDNLNTGLTADTESDLTITFTKAARSIAFTLHNAYIDGEVADDISDVGVVKQSANLMSQSDGTDEGFQIVIVNTQSSATAA